MIKPNFLEKFSFKLAKLIGSPLSLVLHTLIFVSFLVLRYLGIVPNSVLVVLAAAACLEAIYLVIFVQMIIKNNIKGLYDMQSKIEVMQKDEEDAHKLLISMLHMAHQMKTLQHDIDTLKKAGVIKTNGHTQRIRV